MVGVKIVLKSGVKEVIKADIKLAHRDPFRWLIVIVTRNLPKGGRIPIALMIFGILLSQAELLLSLHSILVRFVSFLLVLSALVLLYFNEKSRFSIVTFTESVLYMSLGVSICTIASWLQSPRLSEAIIGFLREEIKKMPLRKYIAGGVVILTVKPLFLSLGIFSLALFVLGLLLFLDRVSRLFIIGPIVSIIHSMRDKFKGEDKALIEPFYIAKDLFIASPRSRCIIQLWSSIDALLKKKYREVTGKEPFKKKEGWLSPLRMMESMAYVWGTDKSALGGPVDQRSRSYFFQFLSQAYDVRNKVVHEGYIPSTQEMVSSFLVGILIIAITLGYDFKIVIKISKSSLRQSVVSRVLSLPSDFIQSR